MTVVVIVDLTHQVNTKPQISTPKRMTSTPRLGKIY